MSEKWDLIIFDCDGVLVDSEPISSGTLIEMLAEIGLSMSPQEASEVFMGLSIVSMMEIVQQRLGRPVPDGLIDQYYARMDAAFRKDLKPVAGITQALDALSLPFCVASSAPHSKMQTTLGVTGLLQRFEGRIFSAEDVERSKPYPDLFLHAAERMGARPERCVVIEDSVPGVRAAVAAGMSVFGYARVSPPMPLEKAGGMIFKDMAELPSLLQIVSPQ